MNVIKTVGINSIGGFLFGHAQDFSAATGCTVVICEDGAVCGVDVHGGSPGTRNTDALNPVFNRKTVHAVLLAGGSAFGLDAAGGVMRFLETRRVGRDVGVTVVPNVCAAILFDLKCGDATVRPDDKMGFAACADAYQNRLLKSGCFGAGTGATIGKLCGLQYAMKGGIGSCAYQKGDLLVGAVVAVNCVGDVCENGQIIAGARRTDGRRFADSEAVILNDYKSNKDFFSGNTIIGCVVTNARFDKAQATRLASQGQNGIARAVRPAHSTFDGDTIFAMCNGEVEASPDAAGILAAAAVEGAILDAVKSAETFGDYISYKDFS